MSVGWLRYEGNNKGKLRFIDIIRKAAVYWDYKYVYTNQNY